jgi:Ca2+-binding RTX toxin-like protein
VLILPVSSAPTQTFTGTGAANKLTGSSGADMIDGRGGADTMTGGAGDDTYVVDNAGDRVVEAAQGGIDTVQSGLASYSLAGNVENLTLTGASQTGIGNELNNILVAGQGGSKLYAGTGNDILVAGSGPDTLSGGLGSDVFRFNVVPSTAGHILDFVQGQDVLDLRDLLRGYVGSDPLADGWVKLQATSAGGVLVMVDTDGPSAAARGMAAVTTVDSVGATLTAQTDWIFH